MLVIANNNKFLVILKKLSLDKSNIEYSHHGIVSLSILVISAPSVVILEAMWS